MTVKIAMLLLAALLIGGVLNRWRAPRVDKNKSQPIEAARKCEKCGAYALASAPCARADCPQR